MTNPVPQVSFTQALLFWLKLGFISFGGPAGQIAIMQRELVDERRWISQARFNHALNYCMLLPGPEAQQLATYIGWLMHRTSGALVAGGLFVLPSFFILIALSWVYVAYGQVPAVASVLWGVQCAVAAIVVHALWRVASRTMPNPKVAAILIALAAMSFIAIAFFHISFLWIVLIAGIVGWLGAKRYPEQFSSGGGHGGAAKAGSEGYVIGDDTPTPAHAMFSKAKMIRILLIGLALWAASMGALVAWQGWSASLTQMGWFFSKAAMVTFGGAYAVLPYVTQTAVANQWLTPDQMMAGLALGETTPGPLIMVVAFVGYVGQALEVQRMGAGANLIGAAMFIMGGLGALVATWFTFLPSFVFILAGGPFVESTHGKLGFTAPLKAISAAVVGAIASLAVLFIQHTVISSKGVDWAALVLMLLAAFALFKLQWGIVRVIVLCAFVGLVRGLI
ncbi:chromate efflux transporter [Variovorax sp. PCZ-1]|uniref:chromate efflux transporter n=1 Tax=Variovorax sp. PCZ-1 TaxID=2835533 RepID=UPI001BCCC56C|nr:chromate efflux transporter [Variovorax sp. PCZ-1]MBS7808864.1 chromate efflux transporter [Variovorax sp. PCZ-1]